jgi:Cu+-exporting ATPase
MTVAVAGAPHVHEHGGETYYFCCGGCLTKFAADPDQHLVA